MTKLRLSPPGGEEVVPVTEPKLVVNEIFGPT